MPTIDELENEIISLLKVYTGLRKEPEANQRLFHDLGLYGDDAWEMLEELSKRYGVTDSQFDGSQYFPNEGEVWPWPFSYFDKKSDKWKPMTVADLTMHMKKAILEKQAFN